ncbi:MAG TPA: hypothetical protein VHB98_01140 [Chloroflexota bacterium]|nr:hypothetical protein [Chloroflexota bacterium]
MSTEQAGQFCWRSVLDGAARVEHPALRQPVSLIVDDPTPGYNPAHFHSGFRSGPLHISPTLIDQFAALVEHTGIRGKFSVVPYPFGLGRVDRKVEGVPDVDLQHFLDVVRTRIAPRMDITPEVLTHWNALDLATGRLLPWWEHVWSRAQTMDTLIPYLSLALQILDAVDLPCSGMTSPWNFGEGVENSYAEALLAAQQAVHGNALTWYFLHADAEARHVPPRLPVFRPAAGEAVVSIVCCDRADFARPLWTGQDPQPDELLTADGQGGRLAEVLRAGGPAVFHTHWQSIFGFGTARGLEGMRTVAERIEAHFGDRVGWIGCAALAAYAAAAAAVIITVGGDSSGVGQAGADALRWQVSAPFACREFTLSLSWARPIRAVAIDDVQLRRVASRGGLGEGSYLVEGDRLYLCWELGGRQQVSLR